MAKKQEEKDSDWKRALRDRMEDPFLFAFVVAFIVTNWDLVFRIVTSKDTNATIEAVNNKWRFLVPALEALAYAVVYPVVHMLVVLGRTKVATWEHNLRKRIELGNWVTLTEVLGNELFQLEKRRAIGLAEYVRNVWGYVTPSPTDIAFLEVLPWAEPILVPRFVHRVNGGKHVSNLREAPKAGENPFVFAFDHVAPDQVVVGSVGHWVRWPSACPGAKIIGLHGVDTVIDPTPEVAAMLTAAVVRSGDDPRFGKFEFTNKK